MLKNQLITPEGTKDYLFEEAAARRYVETRLRRLFENCGYSEVVTPGLEFLDVFLIPGHPLPIEDMYKLSDYKGRLMALRPDSTLPIARLCATRLKGREFPIRLFYDQPVYSAVRNMRGKSDEVTQIGVELIGSSSFKADLEIIAAALKALESCSEQKVRLEIGHIGVLNALMDSLTPDDDLREQIRLSIESKNYPALNDLLDQFAPRPEAEVLKRLPRLFGGEDVIREASVLLKNDKALAALQYLSSLYQSLEKLGLADSLSVDLGIANRADYYTGVVFKGYAEGHGEALLSGGRYDNLLSSFGMTAGAVGFGLNVDAAAQMLLKTGKSLFHSPKVLIFAQKGFETKAIERFITLSDTGTKAEFSLSDTFDEALSYAKQKGIETIEKVGNFTETVSLKAGENA